MKLSLNTQFKWPVFRKENEKVKNDYDSEMKC